MLSPDGTTGPIAVATSGGTATSSTVFTVDPAITGFSPTSGPVGASVTITGSGLTGATAVVFNTSNQPTLTVTSDSQITTTVPGGATSGAISVTTPANTATSSTSFTVTVAPAEPHVMLIVEENQKYGSIIGSSKAPYINTLAKAYALATNWYAVQHPHDYLDLIVGSDVGLPNGTPYSNPTLVDELHSTGIPWVSYMESMPSNCYRGTTSDGLYDPNHNPFHYFTNYTGSAGGWCSGADLSTEGVVPYPGSSGLVTALDATNAPDFVYLVPNACDDMHGDSNTGSPCAGYTNKQRIAAGDTWLNNNLKPVLASTWFGQNGIVIITWDESVSSDTSGCCGLSSPGGHIPTIVVTAGNQGLGNFTGIGDHYGALGAIEEAYGVAELGGSSYVVNGDLTGAFGAAP